jgi:hypothetical protein
MGRSAVLGNHIFFLKEGTLIDTVTVASDAKPDDDPTTNWTDYKLGCIQEVDFSNDASPISIRCPIDDVGGGVPGGVYQASDEIPSQQNLEVGFTIGEINPTVWQAMWLSDTIGPTGPSAAFVPLSASGFMKGWVRLDQYDHNNTHVSRAEFWASLRLNGSVSIGEDDALRAPLVFKVFQNALNTGSLKSFF